MLRLLYRLTLFSLFMALLGGVVLYAAYRHLEPQLPSVETLRDVRLKEPLRIYSRDGALIAEFGEMKRTPLPFAEFPLQLRQAVIAVEDGRFYEHQGVDLLGLSRAAINLLRTGEKGQGGSTITMQVARNFFLSREKTYLRKISEILLSLKIEKELNKDEILELYLNKIYLGKRAYGMAAAGQVYYGKPLNELTLAQMAMLAGLPKAPSAANPLANPDKAIARRNYVLSRMAELGFINNAQFAAAREAPITAKLHTTEIDLDAPYVAEMARAALFDRFGEDAYNNGYHVYTTVKSKNQRAANSALRNQLVAYEQRHGYRGPEAQLPLPANAGSATWMALLEPYQTQGGLLPAIVLNTQIANGKGGRVGLKNGETIDLAWDDINWARRFIALNQRGKAPSQSSDIVKVGDVVRLLVNEPDIKAVKPATAAAAQPATYQLAQIPQVAGALVSLDPEDGSILALVGGFDFYQSKFNRVIQAERQPGSSFKPFIYSAALENGFTTASMINDSPVVFEDASLEADWRPENYSGEFYGPTRMREALIHSRNLVSIRLLRSVGVKTALQHLERFGFPTAKMPANLSLALGTGSFTPLEMIRAYAILANGGYKVDPYLIDRIDESGSATLFQATPLRICPACENTNNEIPSTPPAYPVAPRQIEAGNIFLVRSMMQDVVRYGTGRRAMELKRNDLAGKTGTTNDQRDAWFSGYNSKVATVAWVGFDTPSNLGANETGGKAALPMWMEYMRTALEGIPESTMEPPANIVSRRIDKKNGLLTGADNPDAIFEYFREDHLPEEESHSGTGQGGSGRTVEAITRELF
ncbi:MAG: penicillin-binding protein 1A [Gammaproteobacteria bacterium]|nr:penicillin-binding protein 1A [Gammaproteobacteria bacterium]